MFENCKLEEKLEFVEGDTLQKFHMIGKKVPDGSSSDRYAVSWLWCADFNRPDHLPALFSPYRNLYVQQRL